MLLCITIPLPRKHWEFRKETGDLIILTDTGWNIMYTTWTACFVFGESLMYFASSLCILLAEELYPVIKKRPELYHGQSVHISGSPNNQGMLRGFVPECYELFFMGKYVSFSYMGYIKRSVYDYISFCKI